VIHWTRVRFPPSPPKFLTKYNMNPDFLRTITGFRLYLILFVSSSLLIPGLSYIYIVHSNIFFTIDTIKLLVLGLIYSFPGFLLCIILFPFLDWWVPNEIKRHEEVDLAYLLFPACLFLGSFFFYVGFTRVNTIQPSMFVFLKLLLIFLFSCTVIIKVAKWIMKKFKKKS